MHSDSTRRLLGAEDHLLLAAALLLPWAFGGVEIWAYRTAAFLAVTAACIALWKSGLEAWGLGRGADRRWLLPAALLAGWALFQLVPLPPSVIRAVSPEAHRIYADSLPAYPGPLPDDLLAAVESEALERVPEASAFPSPRPEGHRISVDLPGPRTAWRSISLQPSATQERVFWFLALLAAFLVARRRAADPRVYRVYRAALFVGFTSLAVFGLLQAQLWNGEIYWLRRLPIGATPFGPYINPVHFGGVMELAIVWMTGFAWSRWRHGSSKSDLHIAALAAAAACVCMIAAIMAASRMAILLIAASLLVLGMLGVSTLRRRLAIAGGVVLLVGAVALTLTGTELAEKFRTAMERSDGTRVAEPRLAAWRAGGEMLADFPWTGSGFGTFREVYPMYAPAGGRGRWSQAHNDYLEVLLDGGVIAGVLLLWLAWGYWSRIARGLLSAQRLRAMDRVGLSLGVLVLSLHALVDFNHQIPANALLFVIAAALALERLSDPPSEVGPEASPRRSGVAAAAPVAALVGFYGYRAVVGFTAGIAMLAGALLDREDRNRTAISAFESAAVGINQLEAKHRAADTRLELWGDQWATMGAEGTDPELLERAAADYLSCILLSPASWRPWVGLGTVYDRAEWVGRELRTLESLDLDADPWTRVGRPGRVAVGLMRMSTERGPSWYHLHDRLVVTLWAHGLEKEALEVVQVSARAQPRFSRHHYGRLGGPPPELIDAFIAGSRDALGNAPLLAEERHLVSIARLELTRGNLEAAQEALLKAQEEPGSPADRAEVQYLMGKVYLERGRFEEAEASFTLAAEHPDHDMPALLGLARLARESGRTEAALALFGRLRWIEPEDFDHRLRLGRVAGSLGLTREALEAFEHAHRIRPSAPEPMTRLVETYLEMGEIGRAERSLRELELRTGEGSELTERLRRSLEQAKHRRS